MTLKSSTKEEFKQKLHTIFGLDLRSLALFRIGLGIILLYDLCIRLSDATMFYSDAGVLPRHIYFEVAPYSKIWSLFFISGHPVFAHILILIAILACIPFILGYRTKFTNIFLWLFCVSLYNRNPYIQFGFDKMLIVFLFWGIFLPLDAKYSIHYALKKTRKKATSLIFSWGSIAIILQIWIIYTSTFLWKNNAVWGYHLTALGYAFEIDHLVKPFGVFLLQFPSFLKIGTFLTLLLECVGPFLIFIPIKNDRFKILAVFLFAIFHLLIASTLMLGLFSWMSIVVWTIILPSSFWEKLKKKLRSKKSEKPLIIYYDTQCSFCAKMTSILKTFFLLDNALILPSKEKKEIDTLIKRKNSWIVQDHKNNLHSQFNAFICLLHYSPYHHFLSHIFTIRPLFILGHLCYLFISKNRSLFGYLTQSMEFHQKEEKSKNSSQWIACLCICSVLFYCLTDLINTNMNARKRNVVWPISLKILGLAQRWNLFAIDNAPSGYWYIIKATQENGNQIDLLRNGIPYSNTKPEYIYKDFPNFRWNKWFRAAVQPKYEAYYEPMVNYFASDWNRNHWSQQRIKHIELINFSKISKYPYLENKFQEYTVFEKRILPAITSTEYIQIETPDGNIIIALYGDLAPKLSSIFLEMVNSHYYDEKSSLRKISQNKVIITKKFLQNPLNTPLYRDFFLPQKFTRNILQIKKGSLVCEFSIDKGKKSVSLFSIFLNSQSMSHRKFSVIGEVLEGLDILENLQNNSTAHHLNQLSITNAQHVINIKSQNNED